MAAVYARAVLPRWSLPPSTDPGAGPPFARMRSAAVVTGSAVLQLATYSLLPSLDHSAVVQRGDTPTHSAPLWDGTATLMCNLIGC